MKQKGQIPTDTTIVPNIIVETAIAEVGYTENPPNSNRTKYGEWFGFDGVPWCGMFVSWVYAKAGYPLGNIDF